MNTLTARYRSLIQPLDDLGAYLGLFGLRLLLAWEFWESGVEKFTGVNWFAEIQTRFPFPFDLIPAGVSWQLATWTELLGAIALVIGLGTRFASVALVIVTVVAWSSVHAGLGYNVCHNGYKLALMYVIMLIPLVMSGPGKLSFDAWLAGRRES